MNGTKEEGEREREGEGDGSKQGEHCGGPARGAEDHAGGGVVERLAM